MYHAMIEKLHKKVDEEPRLVETATTRTDAFENKLRPQRLEDYVGQSQLKKNLAVSLEAARARQEPLEHILLYGPPGLGKTTLSHIIAAEMGASIKVTSGPAIDKPGDLASLLTNLQPNDILFIDEIHRLKTTVEEVLYSAMEDYVLDIMIGKGPAARSMRISLPRFTLVGATTKMNMLSSPLRDRFGHVHRLEFYTDDEMTHIVERSADILHMPIDKAAAAEIACRARKTPRIANRLLRRVRDFAHFDNASSISLDLAHHSLEQLGIDALGLDSADRHILQTMMTTFGGRPIGLGTLASATAEEEGTIEDVYEPFLLQIGFIERTPRGRIPTDRAYAHMGILPPQSSLFAA